MPPSATVGWIFPGQGSQKPGMADDLMGASPMFDALLARAQDATGLDLRRMLVEGPEEALRETLAAQLCIFVVSTALAHELRSAGAVPAAVAGHSLGEFSALVAGGWLDAEPALDAVVQRARAMQTACESSDGAMAAVAGLAPDDLERIAAVSGTAAVVANRNTPVQSVISGARPAVERFAAEAREGGARAVTMLGVGGAFHSPLMRTAAEAFAPVVASLPLRRGDVPLVSSISGARVEELDDYRARLAEQIVAPVRWNAAVGALRDLCPGGLIEVGAGRALRAMLRQIDPQIESSGCDSLAACRALTTTSHA